MPADALATDRWDHSTLAEPARSHPEGDLVEALLALAVLRDRDLLTEREFQRARVKVVEHPRAHLGAQLTELTQLQSRGALTEAEFQAVKQQLLA